MKKLVAVLVSLVFALQLIPAAFAAGSAEVTLSSATAKRGETVTITVTVSDCTKVKSMSIRPQFDDDVLEIVSGTWLINGILTDSWSEEFGDAVIAFGYNTNINKDVFVLEFTVKDDAETGAVAEVDCDVVIKTMSGTTEVDVPATVNAGSVTVVEETTPMFRLYNPNSGEHFYTGSEEERDILVDAGWLYEGVAWNAPVVGGTPVHRVYNPNSGDHHYTMDKAEADWLVSLGWKYEGVAWNSASDDNIPQFRMWNPNADCGSHHYTSSEDERDMLIDAGWIWEGIGWYGTLQ